MTATGFEVTGSRRGNADRLTRRYYLEGATDEADVLAFVADLPYSVADLPFADWDYEEKEEINDGGLHDFEITANWGAPKNNTGQKRGTLEYKFNYQAPGGHFKQALETIAEYTDDDYFPLGNPMFGAINVVTDKGIDRVEGQHVQPPAEVFTLSYKCSDEIITNDYQLLVESLVGKVNDSTFRGRPAGSVMLVRVTGGRDTSKTWHIEFGFGYIANDVDIPVGDNIIVDAKDGFDLLWAYYSVKKDDTSLRANMSPTAAYVVRVFYRDDLNKLGLPA